MILNHFDTTPFLWYFSLNLITIYWWEHLKKYGSYNGGTTNKTKGNSISIKNTLNITYYYL